MADEPQAETSAHPDSAGQAVADAFRQIEEAEPAPEPKAAEPESAEESEPKVEPKEEPKEEPKAAEDDGPARNEDGTFKAKESAEAAAPDDKPPVEAKVEEKAPEAPEEDAGIREAPQRFSSDAQAAWKNAPASVRGEVNRLMREMESGLKEHQDRWEPLKELDALARQHGTDIPTAMRQYIAFEQNIRRDPIAGLTQTCRDLGLDFQQIVAEVSGQQIEGMPQTSTAVTALQNRIGELESQLGQVSTTIQTQREDSNLRDVQAFAADHPRFEELSPDIADLLRTGYAQDLPDAYDKAERLKTAPVTASPPAAQTRAPDLAAQTRNASLSVSGAPASGTEPGSKKVPASARDAVASAFAELG